MAQKAQQITAVTDPDKSWTVWANKDYAHNKWASTPQGTWEKRVAAESKMDEFSGINWTKMPTRHGEVYSNETVPLFKYEWDEHQYYQQWSPPKTGEQIAVELDEPRQKMLAKLKEFEDKGESVEWTPTMAALNDTVHKQARRLEYHISPYFQLNKQGYRKNWANVRISEYRPYQRLTAKWEHMFTDHFFRFQLVRWNLSSRIRMRSFKVIMWTGVVLVLMNQQYAKEYHRHWKWH